jgi:Domain of unknown function (DUF927)
MQAYEDALSFLRAVLPPTGRYAVMSKRRGMIHDFFDTIEALAHHCLKLDAAGRETWYALASFGALDERTQANAHMLRALWVDMDVKADKGYPSLDAALGHLDAFCAEGFPEPSIVVSSGYGVHAYWCLEQAAPKAQWQIAADAFQRAWQAYGIIADPVTADAARVLRMPGTHNHKHATPAPVRVIEQTGALYSIADLHMATGGFSQPIPLSSAAATLLPSTDDLMVNLPNRQAFIAPIVQRCRQLAGVAKTRGGDCSEPLWYATVQLARHVENGRAVAQYLSSGHADYDEAAVDAKLTQLEARDIGPTLCERFRSVNPMGCEGCQLKVKSPIQLGDKPPQEIDPGVVVQVPVTDDEGQITIATEERRPPVDLPEGFIQTTEGLMAKVKDEDGLDRHVLLIPGTFYPTRVYRASPTDASLVVDFFAYRQDKGQTYSFSAPNEQLSEPKDVRRLLKRYVNVTMEAAKHMHRLIDLMTNTIQQKEREGISARQMGWQFGHQDTEDNFVHGTTLYRATAPSVQPGISVAPPVEQLAKFCRPRGSLDGAKAGAQLYSKPGGEMHQFVYLYGLAGVFARFTGPQNFALLSLVNRIGGEGKTTNCDAAMAHWFNPQMTRSSPADTDNALFNTMSTRGSLPVFIDEATNMHPARMVNVIYTASQGREKARMDQSGARQRDPLPPWKAPVMLSSNMSVRQMVRAARGDASALDARVIELRYSRLDLPADERARIESVFYDNHGITGPVFTQYVMQRLGAYGEAYEKIRAGVVANLGFAGADRFWLNTVTSVLCAAQAMRQMQVVDYDFGRLAAFSVELLRQQRSDSASEVMGAGDILARFLSHNISRIVVGYQTTNGMDGAARLATLTDQLRSGELVGRSQLNEQALYISVTAFRDFCTEHGHDYRSFVQEAREGRLLSEKIVSGTKLVDGRPVNSYAPPPERYSLGRGTPMASTPSRVITFDLAHPALRDHMADAKSAVAQSQTIRPVYAAMPDQQ